MNVWAVQIQNGEQHLEFLNIYKKSPDWLEERSEIIYDMTILYVGLNMNIQKILGYKFTKFTALHDKEKIKAFIKSGVDVIIIDHLAGVDTIEMCNDLIDTTKTAVMAVSHQPTGMFKCVEDDLVFNPKKERLGNIFQFIIKAVRKNPNIVKRFTRKQK